MSGLVHQCYSHQIIFPGPGFQRFSRLEPHLCLQCGKNAWLSLSDSTARLRHCQPESRFSFFTCNENTQGRLRRLPRDARSLMLSAQTSAFPTPHSLANPRDPVPQPSPLRGLGSSPEHAKAPAGCRDSIEGVRLHLSSAVGAGSTELGAESGFSLSWGQKAGSVPAL